MRLSGTRPLTARSLLPRFIRAQVDGTGWRATPTRPRICENKHYLVTTRGLTPAWNEKPPFQLSPLLSLTAHWGRVGLCSVLKRKRWNSPPVGRRGPSKQDPPSNLSILEPEVEFLGCQAPARDARVRNVLTVPNPTSDRSGDLPSEVLSEAGCGDSPTGVPYPSLLLLREPCPDAQSLPVFEDAQRSRVQKAGEEAELPVRQGGHLDQVPEGYRPDLCGLHPAVE